MHATKETGRLFKKRNSKEVQWGGRGSLKGVGLYTLYRRIYKNVFVYAALCRLIEAYRDSYLQVHWVGIQDAEGTNYMLLAFATPT